MKAATSTSKLLQELFVMAEPDADRVSAAMPEIDRFRLDSALRYLRRADSPFDVVSFVESLVAAKLNRKCARVTTLFRDHASTDEKIELAAGWAFTEPYRFPSAAAPVVRHVMHDDCFADTRRVQDNGAASDPVGCSSGPNTHCPCVQWLRERPTEVDRVLGILIGRLCEMRHSLVHESWPVMMVAEHEEGVGSPSYSSTLLDVYPCDRDDPELFRSYETGVSLKRFRAISTAAARNHLLAAYP